MKIADILSQARAEVAEITGINNLATTALCGQQGPDLLEPVRIHYGPLLIGAWQHFGVIKSAPPAPNRRVR